MTSGEAIGRGISALVSRYGLAPRAGDQMLSLLELVAGDPTAPTTVRNPQAILADHMADSLVALELPVVTEASTIADIGSGAGFPGLPLAIALPASSVTLVESTSRKCAFIGRAIHAAGVANAHVACSRIEEWRDGVAAFELVTARALAPLPVVAEYAAPLLRVGGALVAWRERRDPVDEAAAGMAAEALGLEVLEALAVVPYVGAEHRHLHLMLKVRETPDRFPRRPGVARKRPLGVR